MFNGVQLSLPNYQNLYVYYEKSPITAHFPHLHYFENEILQNQNAKIQNTTLRNLPFVVL